MQRLRLLLGHSAVIQREGRLGLNPREVWLDVWDFSHRLRGQPDADMLVSALALYRGPLLLDDPDPDAVLPARRRLQVIFAAGVERLCEALLADGQTAQALHWSRLAAAIEPTTEALLRRYLTLCLAAGLSTEAVQAYRAYERRLAGELGAAPAATIQALIKPYLNGGA